MTQWIEVKDFIEADVIRWTEGVFDRARRNKKASRLGERRVTAEVLRTEPGGCTPPSDRTHRRSK